MWRIATLLYSWSSSSCLLLWAAASASSGDSADSSELDLDSDFKEQEVVHFHFLHLLRLYGRHDAVTRMIQMDGGLFTILRPKKTLEAQASLTDNCDWLQVVRPS